MRLFYPENMITFSFLWPVVSRWLLYFLFYFAYYEITFHLFVFNCCGLDRDHSAVPEEIKIG